MTRQFKRLAHSLYECKYPLVFCAKYRYRILDGEVAEYVKLQIYGLCQQKERVEVLELNVQYYKPPPLAAVVDPSGV